MARPRPVTILAVLSLFLAFWYLLVGALLSTGKIPIGEMMKQVPQFADMQETFERAAVVFALLFGCAYLFTGIGLLRTMNWARASARVLGVLGLLSALIQMIQAFVARDPVVFLGSAVIGGAFYWAFYYLGQASVRSAFAPHPPPGSAPQPPVASGPDSGM